MKYTKFILFTSLGIGLVLVFSLFGSLPLTQLGLFSTFVNILVLIIVWSVITLLVTLFVKDIENR